MSLTSDQPLLVAPRPVRLTRTHDRPRADPAPPDTPDPASPRASPRSLPAEALEEFLSILRPAAPVPARRPPERPADDTDAPRPPQPTHFPRTPDSDPWFKSIALSSPISRTHTRNPFLRHASNRSPAMISPAAIPLPQPTPDEIVDMS